MGVLYAQLIFFAFAASKALFNMENIIILLLHRRPIDNSYMHILLNTVHAYTLLHGLTSIGWPATCAFLRYDSHPAICDLLHLSMTFTTKCTVACVRYYCLYTVFTFMLITISIYYYIYLYLYYNIIYLYL